MDNIEVCIYNNGLPIARVMTTEVIMESNVEESYDFERGEDGKLRKITVPSISEPPKIKFEGIVVDMDIFNEVCRLREDV